MSILPPHADNVAPPNDPVRLPAAAPPPQNSRIDSVVKKQVAQQNGWDQARSWGSWTLSGLWNTTCFATQAVGYIGAKTLGSTLTLAAHSKADYSYSKEEKAEMYSYIAKAITGNQNNPRSVYLLEQLIKNTVATFPNFIKKQLKKSGFMGSLLPVDNIFGTWLVKNATEGTILTILSRLVNNPSTNPSIDLPKLFDKITAYLEALKKISSDAHSQLSSKTLRQEAAEKMAIEFLNPLLGHEGSYIPVKGGSSSTLVTAGIFDALTSSLANFLLSQASDQKIEAEGKEIAEKQKAASENSFSITEDLSDSETQEFLQGIYKITAFSALLFQIDPSRFFGYSQQEEADIERKIVQSISGTIQQAEEDARVNFLKEMTEKLEQTLRPVFSGYLTSSSLWKSIVPKETSESNRCFKNSIVVYLTSSTRATFLFTLKRFTEKYNQGNGFDLSAFQKSFLAPLQDILSQENASDRIPKAKRLIDSFLEELIGKDGALLPLGPFFNTTGISFKKRISDKLSEILLEKAIANDGLIETLRKKMDENSLKWLPLFASTFRPIAGTGLARPPLQSRVSLSSQDQRTSHLSRLLSSIIIRNYESDAKKRAASFGDGFIEAELNKRFTQLSRAPNVNRNELAAFIRPKIIQNAAISGPTANRFNTRLNSLLDHLFAFLRQNQAEIRKASNQWRDLAQHQLELYLQAILPKLEQVIEAHFEQHPADKDLLTKQVLELVNMIRKNTPPPPSNPRAAIIKNLQDRQINSKVREISEKLFDICLPNKVNVEDNLVLAPLPPTARAAIYHFLKKQIVETSHENGALPGALGLILSKFIAFDPSKLPDNSANEAALKAMFGNVAPDVIKHLSTYASYYAFGDQHESNFSALGGSFIATLQGMADQYSPGSQIDLGDSTVGEQVAKTIYNELSDPLRKQIRGEIAPLTENILLNATKNLCAGMPATPLNPVVQPAGNASTPFQTFYRRFVTHVQQHAHALEADSQGAATYTLHYALQGRTAQEIEEKQAAHLQSWSASLLEKALPQHGQELPVASNEMAETVFNNVEQTAIPTAVATGIRISKDQTMINEMITSFLPDSENPLNPLLQTLLQPFRSLLKLKVIDTIRSFFTDPQNILTDISPPNPSPPTVIPISNAQTQKIVGQAALSIVKTLSPEARLLLKGGTFFGMEKKLEAQIGAQVDQQLSTALGTQSLRDLTTKGLETWNNKWLNANKQAPVGKVPTAEDKKKAERLLLQRMAHQVKMALPNAVAAGYESVKPVLALPFVKLENAVYRGGAALQNTSYLKPIGFMTNRLLLPSMVFSRFVVSGALNFTATLVGQIALMSYRLSHFVVQPLVGTLGLLISFLPFMGRVGLGLKRLAYYDRTLADRTYKLIHDPRHDNLKYHLGDLCIDTFFPGRRLHFIAQKLPSLSADAGNAVIT